MDSVRRFVQGRLPRGAESALAFETGRQHRRVLDEIEGVKSLSADVLLGALHFLSLEDRLRVLAHLAEPLGVRVVSAEPAGIEVRP